MFISCIVFVPTLHLPLSFSLQGFGGPREEPPTSRTTGDYDYNDGGGECAALAFAEQVVSPLIL